MLYQLSYASLILERETGIEPATNSLEGCDSTTELLPHPVSDRGSRNADVDWPSIVQSAFAIRTPQFHDPPLVAREGLEPSKPLGRQIYSLLRLTASLPRQLSVCWKRDVSVVPKDRMRSVDGAGEGI